MAASEIPHQAASARQPHEFLSNDETVECIAPGVFYPWASTAFLVLTDRRLLVLDSRRRSRIRDYPLESVSFAESGWWGITLVANGKKLRINGIHPHDADEITPSIRRRSSARRTGAAPPARRDPYDLGKVPRWRVPEE